MKPTFILRRTNLDSFFREYIGSARIKLRKVY